MSEAAAGDDEAACPGFARGFRLRRDEVRGQWVVLGPERAFLPDAVAVEVLRRVDGATPLAGIIDGLAEAFAAPRAVIAMDVRAMVRDLTAKGVLRVMAVPAA